jgi:hypothetical protein
MVNLIAAHTCTCMHSLFGNELSQQSILETLEQHFSKHPASQADVNVALLERSEAALTELIKLATRHSKCNMLSQFALSRKTQSLIDDATKSFGDAISKLQLGMTVTQMSIICA